MYVHVHVHVHVHGVIIPFPLYYNIVLTIIAAQIPGLDQFRWPGYFIAIHSSLLFIVNALLFWDKWTDLNRKHGRCGLRDASIPGYVSLKLTIYRYMIGGVASEGFTPGLGTLYIILCSNPV